MSMFWVLSRSFPNEKVLFKYVCDPRSLFGDVASDGGSFECLRHGEFIYARGRLQNNHYWL